MPETLDVKPGTTLPPRKHAGGRSAKYPFKTLEVGGIFFIPNRTTAQLSPYAGLQGRKLGRKFSTQMAWMRRDLQSEQWETCVAGAPGSQYGVAITRTK